MKKIIALVLLLSLLSIGSFCAVGSIVGEEKENVTIRENVIYGDLAYADGLSVLTKAHYDDHLFWNTTYTIGEHPTTQNEYTFHYAEHYTSGERVHRALMLDADFQYGVDTRVSAEERVGLQKAYRELYDELAPGEQGKKTIRLQDYYTYYPIRVDIDLPGVLWNGNHYDRILDEDYVNERRVWDRFNEFFRIPIPEDLPSFEISVSRHLNDSSAGAGSSGHGQGYYFNVRSTHTDNRVFFSIGNKYELNDEKETKYVDTSLIPGGYGLYSFTFRNVRNASNTSGNTTTFHPGYETGVEADTLAMVFPLEQYAEVIYLTMSQDQSKLLMFTKEYDITYLTVIDVADMKQLQKIRITDAEHFTFFDYDDFIVLNGWDDIAVIERHPDGLYSLAFHVPRMKEVNDSNFQKGVATAMAFDGEKLAIVDRTGDAVYPSLELCGFTVAIYDQSGLLCYAEYESSLSATTDASNYSFHCLPLEYITSWTK